jgi:hypothetical protein
MASNSDFKQSWIKSFKELAIDLAIKYKQDPESVLCSIKFKSVLDSLNETYQCLVAEKEIVRLEDSGEETKLKYWKLSKKYSNEQFQRIAISKAIYLLDKLTK